MKKSTLYKVDGDKLEKLDKKVIKLDRKVEKLEAEKKDLNLRIEKLIAKYEDKLLDSKKFQVEKFIPKSEIIKDEDKIINEIEAVKEKKTRKSPTKYFVEDLKSLCKDEVILDYEFDKNTDKNDAKPFGQDETYKIEIINPWF